MKNRDTLAKELENALLQINRSKAAEIFERCYVHKKSFEIMENMAMDALESIGAGWEKGSISLSQIYMSGVICEEFIEIYMPKTDAKLKGNHKIAIAVLQDHHALGKRMVFSVLRAGGYQVLDFGQGLSVDELVEKTADNEIEILLISTLMLPSALQVKEVKEQLNHKGINIKIIVGGAPFRLDSTLWARVNADADGKNASNVIKTIEQLLKGDDD